MAISPKLIDQLLEDYQSPADLLGDDGLLQQRGCQKICVNGHSAVE